MSSLDANCNRRLPIFDGKTRFDLQLIPVGVDKIKTKGYEGLAAVCAVRYIPLTGDRRDHPNVRFMANNPDIIVTLVPLTGTGIFVPYRLRMMTMLGPVTIEATHFDLQS